MCYRASFDLDLFDAAPGIRAVTFWGDTDRHARLSTVPATRTSQPLLFDADPKPKAAFRAIVDPAYRP